MTGETVERGELSKTYYDGQVLMTIFWFDNLDKDLNQLYIIQMITLKL